MNQWFGLIDFEESLKIQQVEFLKLQERQISSPKRVCHFSLLGYEHPSVITLGRRANSAQEVFSSHHPIIKTDRGGLATLHSPGQLVLTPMVSTADFSGSLKKTIDFLLKTSELVLNDFGIETHRIGPAGLATSSGKIVFFRFESSKVILVSWNQHQCLQ